ncbi:hypothetical protein ACIGNX_00835 [Actinosynnema sp. NPDC053489]|uniref:hypothetical protein n=1 Tax=Actinosynnema sp. NPDC053489 TaxID=3363916 RepID=UPI0037C5AFDB
MSTPALTRPRVTAQERAAITALITEPEAPVSDAPVYTRPTAALLLLLLSPKLPKEPEDR